MNFFIFNSVGDVFCIFADLGGGVWVAEGDDGDVDVGGLGDGLVVYARVGDDEEARFAEGRLVLVGEGARRVAAGHSRSPAVSRELEDGSLALNLLSVR